MRNPSKGNLGVIAVLFLILLFCWLTFHSLTDGRASETIKHQKFQFKPLPSNAENNITMIKYSTHVHAVIVIARLNEILPAVAFADIRFIIFTGRFTKPITRHLKVLK